MGSAYKLKSLYGDLPLHPKGPNIGRIDRKAVSEKYNFSEKEIKKAYLNWQDIFRFDGSSLKFSEYLDKLKEINISPSDVGNESYQYNLSRYQDLGCYTKENCRFITRLENLQEQFYPAGVSG
jgi:hypothetical protein